MEGIKKNCQILYHRQKIMKPKVSSNSRLGEGVWSHTNNIDFLKLCYHINIESKGREKSHKMTTKYIF